MGVNRIMSWKIVDVKIWFDCTSYASWLYEEKKNWINGCVKWKWEWKDPEEGKHEKKREMRNERTLERANKEGNEISRVKDPKVYLEKTSNRECI